jgi:hypothetical protein
MDATDNAGIDGLARLDLCLFLLAFCDDLTRRQGCAAFDRGETQAVLPV